LPANEVLVAADRGHLWTTQMPRTRVPATVARYRLDATPAQPPRSGRGGATQRTSRQ
jgi:hypothetical protein